MNNLGDPSPIKLTLDVYRSALEDEFRKSKSINGHLLRSSVDARPKSPARGNTMSRRTSISRSRGSKHGDLSTGRLRNSLEDLEGKLRANEGQNRRLQKEIDDFLVRLPLGTDSRSADIENAVADRLFEAELSKLRLQDRLQQYAEVAVELQNVVERQQNQMRDSSRHGSPIDGRGRRQVQNSKTSTLVEHPSQSLSAVTCKVLVTDLDELHSLSCEPHRHLLRPRVVRSSILGCAVAAACRLAPSFCGQSRSSPAIRLAALYKLLKISTNPFPNSAFETLWTLHSLVVGHVAPTHAPIPSRPPCPAAPLQLGTRRHCPPGL